MTEQKIEQDPLLTASNAYKLLLENDRARVMRVTFKPNYTTKIHSHPDHVVYVLKGGRIRFSSEGTADEMDLTTGTAILLEAQSHEATNIGNSEIELITVELKKPS